MKFGIDVNDSQRLKPGDVGDPLTLTEPPAGQSFHLHTYTVNYLSTCKVDCHRIHGSQMMYPNDCGDPLTFYLAPPSVQSVHFFQYFGFALNSKTNDIPISLICTFF